MRARGRLLIAASVVVLAVLLAAWLGWRRMQHDADAALAAAAPRAPASQALADAWLQPATQQGVAPDVAAATSAAASESTSIDICGVGRIDVVQMLSWGPTEMLKAKAQADALERRRDAELSRMSARLAAGSASERVAARLLMKDVEGAALLAAGSGDAAAYRLALRGCRSPRDKHEAPSCQGLTAQGWLRLDPDDARAWLGVMEEAMNRSDSEAAVQAMEQALRRDMRGSRNPLLTAIAGMPAGSDALGRGLAAQDISVNEVMMADFPFLHLGSHCRRDALKDPARRERCERIARWQLAQADNLSDAEGALNLADRLGVPVDQRPYTREQLKQGRRIIDSMVGSVGFDCDSLARTAAWPGRLVQRSELQWALSAAPGR